MDGSVSRVSPALEFTTVDSHLRTPPGPHGFGCAPAAIYIREINLNRANLSDFTRLREPLASLDGKWDQLTLCHH
ncbi:hypothetical protein ACWC0C_32795 [Streptomyces sp. NPDC001709]